MVFGPKKLHPIFIVENFIRDFGILLIAVAIGLIRKDFGYLMDNAVVLVIALLGPVTRVIQYFCTSYQIDEEKLTLKSGWLTKKKLEIPLSTITTVDFSQNLIHQMVDAYRLNVDNASNVAEEQTKVNLTLAEKDAVVVRALLLRKQAGSDGVYVAGAEAGSAACDGSGGRMSETEAMLAAVPGKRMTVPVTDLLILGALKSKGVFLLQLFGIVSSAVALFNLSDTFYLSALERLIPVLGVTKLALCSIAVLFVVAVICGMIGTLIKYYGFRILDDGKSLKIEYGLLTQKKYTIQKDRISGFLYEQSFFLRRFHRGTLKLFAIGYGSNGSEESSEEPILFPLLQEASVRQIMAEILPEMAEESESYRPERRAFRYFFYGFGFVLSWVVLAAAIYLSLENVVFQGFWMVGLLVPLISMTGRTLQYFHTSVSANDRNISMTCGGFRKVAVFVKTDHVESVSRTAGIRRAKKGIVHISIGYIAPLEAANQKVRNISVEAFHLIRQKLIY